MGLRLELFSYVFLYEFNTHFGFTIRRIEILTMKCKSKTCNHPFFFSNNNTSEPVPPKDFDRDNRTPLLLKDLQSGRRNAMFPRGLQKRCSGEYTELHEKAFTKLAKNSFKFKLPSMKCL